MNQKLKITEKVAEILNLPNDFNSLVKYLNLWWKNPRKKEKGGLKLTKEGWQKLNDAGIKGHVVKLEERIEIFENQLVIYLDHFIDCPWFLHRDSIWLYGDKTAVDLILFSGDLKGYIKSKIKVLETN